MAPTGFPTSVSGFAQEVAPDGWEADGAVRAGPTFATEQFIVRHYDQDVEDVWPEFNGANYVDSEWLGPTPEATVAGWWYQSTPPIQGLSAQLSSVGVSSDHMTLPELSEDSSITPLRLPSPALPVPAGNGYPPVGNYYHAVHHGYHLAGPVYHPAGPVQPDHDAWSTDAQDGHYAVSPQASSEAPLDHALPSVMNQFSNMLLQTATPAQQSINNVVEDYHAQGSVFLNGMSVLRTTGQENLAAAASRVSTTVQDMFTVGQQDLIQLGEQLRMFELGQDLINLVQRQSLRQKWKIWYGLYMEEVEDVRSMFTAEFAPRPATRGSSPVVERYLSRLQLANHESSSRARRADLEAKLRAYVCDLSQDNAASNDFAVQSREDALEVLLDQQIVEMQDRKRQRQAARVDEYAVGTDILAVLANEDMEDLNVSFNADLGAGLGAGFGAGMGM